MSGVGSVHPMFSVCGRGRTRLSVCGLGFRVQGLGFRGTKETGLGFGLGFLENRIRNFGLGSPIEKTETE
jgi:hypothetical protein